MQLSVDQETPVGRLPSGWEAIPLGNVLEITSSKRVFRSEWKRDGVPFYRAREIAVLAEEGVVDNELFISREMYEEYKRSNGVPAPGDLLITGVGTLGKVWVVPQKEEFYFKDGNIIWLRLAGRVDSEFLRQMYKMPFLERQVHQSSAGTTVGTYTIGAAKRTVIPLPGVEEQSAIAEVLSDIDQLISGLEQVLAKKRQIKQGAMQELLTGRRRLPGFSGEWSRTEFGELFLFSGGLLASRDQLSSEGHAYLHYGDIHTSDRSSVDVGAEHGDLPKLDVRLAHVRRSALLDHGDVVFVDASEDTDGMSKHVVILNPAQIPYIAGLHTIVAKSRTKVLDVEYRRFCFHTDDVQEQFRFYAVGTKVFGVSKANIRKIALRYPSLAEQRAIASVLSDLEAEIASLEAKLAKARQFKQGMMHELLTGRIRLLSGDPRK